MPVDQEKILLKIGNPVNPEEYIALIYLWQKSFAKKMRDKFFDLWQIAEKLEINLALS